MKVENSKPLNSKNSCDLVSQEEVKKIYYLPATELLYRAQKTHRAHFNSQKIQTSKLLSIKTGGCPENCAYCPQSAHYKTGIQRQKLMEVKQVTALAKKAKAEGATRFCMGSAWREIPDGPAFERVLEMVSAVKSLDMEVCCTLGMLTKSQAQKLKKAGLYAYNHNIDCSENFYPNIITTRKYADRLQTIRNVRWAGITVCTGGIVGMGESHQDRIDFLHQLAIFDPQPESVTINKLIPIPGTPLGKQPSLSALDLMRVIATARLIMPKAMIRLSAGRKGMPPSDQFLCFFAGANSIFIGDKLLTSSNPELLNDTTMLKSLGLSSSSQKELLSLKQ